MALNATVGNRNVETFVRWGVAPGPALWPTVIRILFVIDGRINTSKNPSSFGLGYVLDTLRNDGFAWWVRFEVQVVRRDHAELVQTSQDYPDTNYTVGNAPNFDTLGFKFTEANFSLDDWDQVWLFGDNPANLSDNIYDPNYPFFNPLGDDELKLLAGWMDGGGGVFAAGDHWNLGSAMCSRIPRVRTMRKWTLEQGLPAQDGDTRNQTLQPVEGQGNPDVLEGDTLPQPIELVYQPLVNSILTRPPITHPILTTPTGVIDTFPDHMHEGEIINDDDVELDSPLNIAGYNRPEYPFVEPQINPGTAARITLGGGPVRPRPRPHVIAYGRTTNLSPLDRPPDAGGNALARVAGGFGYGTKRFGLVGAYDGDSAGIGRVVVDSTWHHWFSYNLHGFYAEQPQTQYELMQAYYQNVGLWLAGLAQRQSIVTAAIWGVVVSDPMAFPVAQTRSLWAVGKRAVDVMSRTVSPSMLQDFVASPFRGRAEELFGVPNDVNPADPYVASVPSDLAVRAIVGGIASSLIRPASDYVQARGKPRRLLDPVAIAQHAVEGLKQGHRALIDTIQSSAAASKSMVTKLEEAFQPSVPGPIQVELTGLRVVAERLQLPDPTDPVLVDIRRAAVKAGSTRFTITLRIALAGSVVTQAVMDDLEFPSFQLGGAFIDIDRDLYGGVVQSGESLVVEVVTGAAGPGQSAGEQVRFTDTLDGEPSNWVGSHSPSRSQLWRLWYRIEKTGDTEGKLRR